MKKVKTLHLLIERCGQCPYCQERCMINNYVCGNRTKGRVLELNKNTVHPDCPLEDVEITIDINGNNIKKKE